MNYTRFNVGEKELKLCLDAKNTVALERVLGTNPVNELRNCSEKEHLPSLDFISATLHASLQKYQHGYTLTKVYDLIDEFIGEGKNLTDFLPVLIDVFQVSGFIPKGTDEVEQGPK